MNAWFHVHSRYPGFSVRLGRQTAEERLDITVTLSDEETRALHAELGRAIAARDVEANPSGSEGER
jgi:hypothetical protein